MAVNVKSYRINLNPQHHATMRVLAAQNGITTSSLYRGMVAEFLSGYEGLTKKKKKKKGRE